MTDLFRHRTTAIWAALVACTCLPLAFGAAHGARVAVASALVIAFVKVRFVGLEFMELRNANKVLRRLFQAWALLVGTAVLVLYLAG
jgi:hypothetical protein